MMSAFVGKAGITRTLRNGPLMIQSGHELTGYRPFQNPTFS